MAHRVELLSEWHQDQNGCWTRSYRFGGLRARLFEKRSGRGFYRELRLPNGTKDRKALGTLKRNEAEALLKQFFAALEAQATSPLGLPSLPARKEVLTLGSLWAKYRRSCQAFLDNKESTRKDDETRARILIGYFGASLDVSRLTADDQARYQKLRMQGGIEYTREGVYKKDANGVPTRELEEFITRKTRARTPQSDLVLLHTMLRWATQARDVDGKYLLDKHPLLGVQRRAEVNPLQPVATWDRYVATRDAIKKLAAAEDEGSPERTKWVKIELALVLAEATGRRLSSIRQLRWEEIDLSRREILWSAEKDKKGADWTVPLTEELATELIEFRRRLGAISGWLFPGSLKPDRPMDRHQFDKWLTVAERAAGLPKLEGGLWHPYRRKWATERKHLPISDVAAVGGWKDVETLLKSYSKADRSTMLSVLQEPRRVRDGDFTGQAGSRTRTG